MRQGTRQRVLPFARRGQWEGLPAEKQEQCRKLLSQLLAEVVMAESRTRRENNE